MKMVDITRWILYCSRIWNNWDMLRIEKTLDFSEAVHQSERPRLFSSEKCSEHHFDSAEQKGRFKNKWDAKTTNKNTLWDDQTRCHKWKRCKKKQLTIISEVSGLKTCLLPFGTFKSMIVPFLKLGCGFVLWNIGWFFSRWWFQTFFMFIPTWGNDPIWLVFFRWVETTN